MKNPDRSDSAEHPKEFLLPYVEDLLPVEERTVMDQHLRSCQECSREVTELDYIIGTLRTHKEVFCPDPWLLQDYVDLGQDPGDRISEHLKECASCSEELSHVKSSPAESIMPPRVREAFEEHYASGPAPLREAVTVSVFSVLYGYLSDLFRLPVLAIGAAAAAIVVAVLIYPRESVSPVIGLSALTWDQMEATPKTVMMPKGLTLMGPPRTGDSGSEQRARIALVALLSGFEPPPDQGRIDSFYRALAPLRDLSQRLDLLDPAQVKEALSKEEIRRPDEKYLASKLGKDLDADAALLIKLKSKDGKISIEAEMIEAATGKLVGRKSSEPLSESDLPSALKACASELLERVKSKD